MRLDSEITRVRGEKPCNAADLLCFWGKRGELYIEEVKDTKEESFESGEGMNL